MVANPKQIYEFGAFRLDLTEHLLTRKGKPVALTPKAFEVLVWLIERRGHLVEKDELMREVWPDSIVEEGNLSRTVWMLRQALDDDRNGHGMIQTVPKHGYRFTAEVETIERIVETQSRNRQAKPPKEVAIDPESRTSPEGGVASSSAFQSRPILVWLFVPFVLATVVFGGWLMIGNSSTSLQPPSRSPEAQDAYFRGIFSCTDARTQRQKTETAELYLRGFASFDKAIELEPTWDDAYAELARCYVWRAAGDADYYPKAKVAALKAIQLNGANALAHESLAFALWRGEWDVSGAEPEFDRAMEISGDNRNIGHPGYGLFLSATGRHEKAIEVTRQAGEADPYNIVIRQNLGFTNLRAGKYGPAIQHFRTALDLNSNEYLARIGLGVTLPCAGRFTEAIDETKKAIEVGVDPLPTADSRMETLRLAWVFAKAGRREEATEILDQVLNLPEPVHASRNVMDIAAVYAELGDRDKAFFWLEKAFDERQQTLVWLKTQPEFERLRGDVRFDQMLRRLGLEP